MPRLWADTMDSHRRQVNDAILNATAELIAQHGPLSVSMSAIAQRAGIGRATLYKYFTDVEAVLQAWHARAFAGHLDRLTSLDEADEVTLDDVTDLVLARRRLHPDGSAGDQVEALAYLLTSGAAGPAHAARHEAVGVLVRLLHKLAQAGLIRTDIEPGLLAHWIIHVAHAPGSLDDTAVERLLRDSLTPAAR